MLSNLTIRAKLSIAFSGLAIMVLAVAGLSLRSLNDANDRFVHYINGIEARAKMAEEVRTAVDRRAIAARNLVLVSKSADLENEKTLVTQAHQDVVAHLSKLKEMVTAPDASDKARSLVADIDKIEQSYGPVALAIVNLALNGQKDVAISKMNDECRPLLAALIKATTEYASFTVTRARGLTSDAQESYATQRNLLFIACLIAVVAAGSAGVLLTRSIAGPITQAVRVAESVADGDLTLQIHSKGRDEVSQLLVALSRMSQSLRNVVSQVRQSSDSIATGSTQIATGNSDLSQRTEEQASALQQTAASMEQLGSTVTQNADNARQANQLAKSASTVAEQGGHVVSQVVGTMRGISESSKKIADIIGTIDSIAFQTNILALNAAVEAARAGEQGRGFAVVASEVRNLAQRSAQAAKEIKALITDSVERVEQGTTLVDQAGRTMNEIVSSILRVTDIMGEISAASTEQSSSVGQVGAAVAEIDRGTQQNAALVEEMAAAATSLSGQAQDLVRSVAVFKIEQRSLTVALDTRQAPVTRPSQAAAGSLPLAKRPAVAKPLASAAPKLTTATAAAGEGWESF
ncbi:methyl-accepting chemotaxis protein [Variovorax sp. HJSM1_2]|uniref:methyl-accepting chemotaxis protein n=1 Tax=Variovorax sp. HJSM1_2 TaxID=3366263 RepID=UPI003BD8C041